jgi:hypothetical protein
MVAESSASIILPVGKVSAIAESIKKCCDKAFAVISTILHGYDRVSEQKTTNNQIHK